MRNQTTTTSAAPDSSLKTAMDLADSFIYQSNRVAVALRSLGDVINNQDNPISPGNVAGLCEAVQLVGEHLEWYALDQKYLLEHLEAERQRKAAGEEVAQ